MPKFMTPAQAAPKFGGKAQPPASFTGTPKTGTSKPDAPINGVMPQPQYATGEGDLAAINKK